MEIERERNRVSVGLDVSSGGKCESGQGSSSLQGGRGERNRVRLLIEAERNAPEFSYLRK